MCLATLSTDADNYDFGDMLARTCACFKKGVGNNLTDDPLLFGTLENKAPGDVGPASSIKMSSASEDDDNKLLRLWKRSSPRPSPLSTAELAPHVPPNRTKMACNVANAGRLDRNRFLIYGYTSFNGAMQKPKGENLCCEFAATSLAGPTKHGRSTRPHIETLWSCPKQR
jgi:hypothetical protein